MWIFYNNNSGFRYQNIKYRYIILLKYIELPVYTVYIQIQVDAEFMKTPPSSSYRQRPVVNPSARASSCALPFVSGRKKAMNCASIAVNRKRRSTMIRPWSCGLIDLRIKWINLLEGDRSRCQPRKAGSVDEHNEGVEFPRVFDGNNWSRTDFAWMIF